MTELKSCPFCGCKNNKIVEKMSLYSTGKDNKGNNTFVEKQSYQVECGNLCCKLNKYFKTKEEAVEAWNSRI